MVSRLKSIPITKLLADKRIIITGCSFRPVKYVFHDLTTNEETHDSIFINKKEMKVNIGTTAAFVLAANGATVHLVSRTGEKLKIIKDCITNITKTPKNKVEYSKVDLLNEKSVQAFAKHLPKDKPLYWVQSIGLGAEDYKLKDNNPYLHIEDIPVELLEMESKIVLKGTHILMQNLLPIFRKQNKRFHQETRVVIVSSMSAVRGYNRGGTHSAAKGAISRYANSAMLDLWKEKIYITDVRPGDIDTGLYDNKVVRDAILDIVKEYGQKKISMAPPISIGCIINSILTIPAQITSVNLVAMGQHPHEGS